MTSIAIAFLAFAVTFGAANRSLRLGLCSVIGVGYLYGIVRANLPDIYTYLMFDLAAISLYLVQIWRPMTIEQRIGSRELRLWVAALIGWPILLFTLFPTSSPLVEAVGLRANVFLLPFLIFGARLTYDDLRQFTFFLAGMNILAVLVAGAEYYLGVSAFFPRNEVTELIYRSHDLLGQAFRIPSFFANAHAFAGTMAVTLPLLIGAWAQERESPRSWRQIMLVVAIIGSFLGIFMAAARIHTITAGLIALMVTFSGRLSRKQWVRWAAAIAIIAYVVAGNVRLQRFTTLSDRAAVNERIGGSVNEDFVTVISAHPFGRGLAGGGTSIPYFLQVPRNYGAILENEYARIALEEGLPGLVLWLGFMTWVLLKGFGPPRDEWALTRRLVWLVAGANFVAGMLGMGMLVAVPQTALMLLSIGWMTTTRGLASAAARRPAALRRAEQLAS
jgi:hypothetical protein